MKYKKENKELVSYYLFNKGDEAEYVEMVNNELTELFEMIPRNGKYKEVKQIRKILRIANKQIKYSGLATTQVEVLMHFTKLLKPKVKSLQMLALDNMYMQQLKKINIAMGKLHEDLQYDYLKQLSELEG
jgi:CTP:phosphocholine cytidylyltransferase-like protein